MFCVTPADPLHERRSVEPQSRRGRLPALRSGAASGRAGEMVARLLAVSFPSGPRAAKPDRGLARRVWSLRSAQLREVHSVAGRLSVEGPARPVPPAPLGDRWLRSPWL